MSWPVVKLKDCCQSIADGDHQAPPKVDQGVPFITISNIIHNELDFTNTMFVPESYYNSIDNKRRAKKGDILYSVVGSFGIPVLITEDKKFSFQRHIAILRPNISMIDKYFLYYTMLCPDFYAMADAVAIGAAQRTISLNSLRNLEIKLPPLNIQKKIVNIISPYDALIKNNNKQIKLLEEAAQRLYKEWFLDLRFPGHESTKIVDGVPEGWKICKLQDAIEFNPNIKISQNRLKQHIPMSALSISSMLLDFDVVTQTKSTTGSKFQNGDTLLAKITPCLENGKTAFVWGLDSDEGAVGSTEYVVMRSRSLTPYFVYLFARTENFRNIAISSMSGSDGRQRVNIPQLKNFDFIHPTEKIIDIFSSIVKPMFMQNYKLKFINKKLIKIRNYFLQHIMNKYL